MRADCKYQQFMHFDNLNARMSFKKDLYSSTENNDLRKNPFEFTIYFAYRSTKGKLIFLLAPNDYKNQSLQSQFKSYHHNFLTPFGNP